MKSNNYIKELYEYQKILKKIPGFQVLSRSSFLKNTPYKISIRGPRWVIYKAPRKYIDSRDWSQRHCTPVKLDELLADEEVPAKLKKIVIFNLEKFMR